MHYHHLRMTSRLVESILPLHTYSGMSFHLSRMLALKGTEGLAPQTGPAQMPSRALKCKQEIQRAEKSHSKLYQPLLIPSSIRTTQFCCSQDKVSDRIPMTYQKWEKARLWGPQANSSLSTADLVVQSEQNYIFQHKSGTRIQKGVCMKNK